MNRVCVVGRVVAPADIKVLPSGDKVGKFRIAVWQGKDDTGYFNCIVFGKTIEILEKIIKGDEVGVEGKLKQRRYQRKDGSNAEIIEITVDVLTRFFTQQPAKLSAEDVGGSLIDNLPEAPTSDEDDALPF